MLEAPAHGPGDELAVPRAHAKRSLWPRVTAHRRVSRPPAQLTPGLARAFGLALVAGVLLAACAGPAASGSGQAPGAGLETPPATAVATAQAVVKRLLDNTAPPTPTPTPTPVAAPACQGATWWFDAYRHVGERVTVAGRVAGALRDDSSDLVAVNLGQPAPDPNRFVVLLPASPDPTAGIQAAGRSAKGVCVRGLIVWYQGVPALRADSAAALQPAP